jgi:Invasion associated locus B (IalB) protein
MIAISRKSIPVLAAAFALLASAASADTPTLLGISKDWTAFTSGSGSSKFCYALSKPTSTTPKKKRDAIYMLITDWPNRRAKAEPEIVPGYLYKEGSKVTATVGGTAFDLFVKNENGAGAAWVRHHDDEARLIDAMRNGSTLVVTGTSSHGSTTKDTYSLAGLGDALDRIHSACGM